jgi:hypothetical protein
LFEIMYKFPRSSMSQQEIKESFNSHNLVLEKSCVYEFEQKSIRNIRSKLFMLLII